MRETDVVCRAYDDVMTVSSVGVDVPHFRSCKTQGATIAEFVLPPDFAVPEHRHSPPHIVVILDGEMADVDRTEQVLPPGSLRYSPGGDHHRVRISSAGTHCLVVEAPGFPELHLRHRVYAEGEQCADVIRLLRQWLFSEPSASPARIEDCALSMFCQVRRIEHGAPPPWVGEIREMLDQAEGCTAPLAQAAKLVRRSPSLVARAFRAEHAVSIHRYYRRRQIDRAWGMISETSESLSRIATACGFADQSHMTRTFVRETGEAPARLRASLGAATYRNWYQAVPLAVLGAG
jgi:AraC-like DNA-binding protein/quercetin dioxygenase-like cupin family protein